MSNIVAGKKVRHIAGGPLMGVRKVQQWNGVMEADCDWFDRSELKSASFPLNSLKLEEDESERPSFSAEAGLGGGPDSWMR